MVPTGNEERLKSDDFWVSGSSQRPQIGPKSPCTWVKKVFLVVSIHFQVNLKVTQNLKKIGEMVLAHHGKMVFT